MENNKIKLDKRNLKILEILDFNARVTYADIAKKVKISKQAVEQRIKKLERKKIISSYYLLVDISKLGYSAHRIALKLQNTSQEKQKEITNYLMTQKNIGWLFELGGKWDLAITIYSKNLIDLEEISKKLTHKFSQYIKEKSISTILYFYNFPNKFLFNSKENKKIKIGGDLIKNKIDKIDSNILLELSKNSRQSILKISEKLKQNPKTILYRIKRLEKNKIIVGYRADINTKLLEYDQYKIFLYLKNITKQIEEKIIEYLRNIKNSVYLTSAIGIADLEFELKVKNSEELYSIIEKLRQKFKNYFKDFETLFIRKEIIISYFPET